MVPWRDAMERALYGVQGFYRQGQRPDDHFRTSVHATPLFSSAIARLIIEVDTQLDHPDPFDVVDIGAGRAELLHSLLTSLPEHLVRRARLTAVEVVERPDDVDPTIAWTTALPTGINGVILANEWLDNIPVTVAERSDRGVAQVLVDEDGTESLGEPVSTGDQGWLDRWWPLTEDVGDRAEVGASRDAAWRNTVSALQQGVALCIDYQHDLVSRSRGDYAAGTLAGFRSGRLVRPIPNGCCDITAHVALDSCAAAGSLAGAEATLLTTQRQALAALGISANRPAIELATSDPAAYVQQLSKASEAAELLDPSGLGGFGWLAQTQRMVLPPTFRPLCDDAGRRPAP